jgi:hypothetical protein
MGKHNFIVALNSELYESNNVAKEFYIFLNTAIAKLNQPIINRKPPIGVTAPNFVMPVKQSI